MPDDNVAPYKIARLWSGTIEVETYNGAFSLTNGEPGFAGWDKMLRDANEHFRAEQIKESRLAKEQFEGDLLELFERELPVRGRALANLRYHARVVRHFVTRVVEAATPILAPMRSRYRCAYFVWLRKAG